MRITLLALVLFFGGFIGVNAITSINKMQDSKMARFCKQVPVGASYDDLCAKYR
jgi:hypothetical protein